MSYGYQDHIDRAAEYLDSKEIIQMELRVANSKSLLTNEDDLFGHFTAGAVFGAAQVLHAIEEGEIATKDQSDRIARLQMELQKTKRK